MNINHQHTKNYHTLKDVDNYQYLWDIKTWIQDAELKMQSQGYDHTRILRDKAVFAITYVTAGRVSEIANIKLYDMYMYISNSRKYLMIKLTNKKNKKEIVKYCISNYKNESYFIDTIYQYYKLRLKEEGLNYNPKKLIYRDFDDYQNIIPILNKPFAVAYICTSGNIMPDTIRRALGFSRIQRIFNKWFNTNHHFLRHVRLTHLSNIYRMSAKEIEKFAGHSSILSAEPYIRINKDVVEDRMDKVVR
jgi:integrase